MLLIKYYSYCGGKEQTFLKYLDSQTCMPSVNGELLVLGECVLVLISCPDPLGSTWRCLLCPSLRVSRAQVDLFF